MGPFVLANGFNKTVILASTTAVIREDDIFAGKCPALIHATATWEREKPSLT